MSAKWTALAAWRRFLREEHGPTATEYAVLLALILIVAIAGISIHGGWLGPKLADMNSAMFGG